MASHVRYCPYCGGRFTQVTDERDSRIPVGYRCERCDETLQIRVRRFSMFETANE